MSQKLPQPTTEATRSTAPVSARRRAVTQFPGLPSKPKTDDVPILIRIPDLAKFAAQTRREEPPAIAPAYAAVVKIHEPVRPVEATLPKLQSTETAEPTAESANRAEQRRRRRAIEEQPAQDWRHLAMQWGVILAIVIVVSIAFHLFNGNGKSEPTQSESATNNASETSKSAGSAAGSLENKSSGIEPAPIPSDNLEPPQTAPIVNETKTPLVNLPDASAPAPKLADPSRYPSLDVAPSEPISNPSTPPTFENDRRLIPNENSSPDVRDFNPETAPYPTTDPNNYFYRPGSTANPGSLPFDSYGRDSQLNNGASSRESFSDPLRDDSVRAARIRGIQNLPTRERR